MNAPWQYIDKVELKRWKRRKKINIFADGDNRTNGTKQLKKNDSKHNYLQLLSAKIEFHGARA